MYVYDCICIVNMYIYIYKHICYTRLRCPNEYTLAPQSSLNDGPSGRDAAADRKLRPQDCRHWPMSTCHGNWKKTAKETPIEYKSI